MVAIRITNILFGSMHATRYRAPRTYRRFVTTPGLLAQGYGDSNGGGPISENPQKQPPSNKAQESSEHPGPAPPDIGKGTGGATKAAFSESMTNAISAKSPAEASAQSGGSRSKQAKETGSSPTGGEIGEGDSGSSADKASREGGEALKGPRGKGTPSPKIHNQAIPGTKEGLSQEQKNEVELHNKDFNKRHDRAQPASDDKVDKKFWKGTAGRQGTENDWNA